MRTKILACQTIEDEVRYVLNELNLDYEILWVESGLHNVPKKLKKRVQECLDQITDCDRVLLAFGRCGNSMDEIKAGDFEVILPKVDDCISLFFGSDDARNEYGSKNHAYFLTEGWMRGERTIMAEYEHSVERFGEEMAEELLEMMYGHYETLALLDMGVNPIERLYEMAEATEEKLHLKRAIVPATLQYLKDLMSGPWPKDRFYVLKPGETLDIMEDKLAGNA